MAARHDTSPTALTAARRREAAKRGPAREGRGSGLTPKVRKAIQILVHGVEGDRAAPVTIAAAAALAGISERGLQIARLKPAVEGFYQREYAAMRNGERPASIRRIASLRDDATLRATPTGAKVVLDASKTLAFDPPGQTNQINVQVNNNLRLTPGYVIDLTEDTHRQIEHVDEREASILPVPVVAYD